MIQNNARLPPPYISSCFRISAISLLILGVVAVILGSVAFYSPLPKSLADYHRLLFFCKIDREYSYLMMGGGAILYLIGILGLTHFAYFQQAFTIEPVKKR